MPSYRTSIGHAFFAIVLAGCASPTMSPAPSASPDTVDCGFEDSGHGENLNVEGRRCLVAAFEAGEQAMFVSAGITVEGAPITRSYRVTADGILQIAHDARRDPLGSGKIELLQCAGLVSVDDWNEANGANLPADYVFVEDGCEVIAQ